MKIVDLTPPDDISYDQFYERLTRLLAEGLHLFGTVEMLGLLEIIKYRMMAEEYEDD